MAVALAPMSKGAKTRAEMLEMSRAMALPPWMAAIMRAEPAEGAPGAEAQNLTEAVASAVVIATEGLAEWMPPMAAEAMLELAQAQQRLAETTETLVGV